MKQEYIHLNTGYETIIYDKDGRAFVYSPELVTKNIKINDEVPF